MWKAKNNPTEPIQCPVCKALLGKRDHNESFIGHCKECKTIFVWKSRMNKPSATLENQISKGCGCGGCGR